MSILKKHHRSFYERLDNINCLKYQDFTEFCSIFLSSFKTKILIQGNIIKSSALGILESLMINFDASETINLNDENQILKIPVGSSYLRLKSSRRNDINSVVKNYYQIGKSTITKDCNTELIVSLLYEPLFDTLRTQDQLGYEVACTLRKNCGILGITITVEYQESKNSANFIELKIEEFLRNYIKTLKEMSENEFSSLKRSVISLKLIEDCDLEKEINKNWDEIRIGENCFHRKNIEAQEIEKISKSDVVDFYHNTFLSDGRKLSVQIIGDQISNSKSQINNGENFSSIHFINNLKTFKKNLENHSINKN